MIRIALLATMTAVTWLTTPTGVLASSPRIPPVFTPADSAVESVSCAAAGNCSAGGYYSDRLGAAQAFVVSEVHGAWGKPHAVTGPLNINPSGGASIQSVSCAAAGTCGAGGFVNQGYQAFVVSQVNGRWRRAADVLGLGALGAVGGAQVTSVSCAAAGSCSAGGDYQTANSGSGFNHGFVVDEVHGVWGSAQEVPGLAALNTGVGPFGGAVVTAVSCASAGNCSAAGSYLDSSLNEQAFVADEVHGVWGTAQEVPGLATLNVGGRAQVTSLSCDAAGYCSAGGTYQAIANSNGGYQGFVADEVHGVWGSAQEVPRPGGA